MTSNSNGQSPFSVDGSAIQQTQPPAPRQLSSVDTTTDTTTGNTQNQHRYLLEILREKISGGDKLLKLSKTFLVTNFSAAIAMVIFRSEGSPLQSALNSKSFGILVACIAIGFTCNMNVILLQKESPVAASIGEYAGVFTSAIGFLTMIQMILPLTLRWIVWLAGVSIFISFLFVLAQRRDDTKDEIAMFCWEGEILSDYESVRYIGGVKELCKVKKETTLHELKAMIKAKVPQIGENVQLKFTCRFPSWESINGVKYELLPINNDGVLALVLNQPKNSWSRSTLQFYVEWNESLMGDNTSPV